MDIADRAQQKEEAERAASLAAHHDRDQAAAYLIEGEPHCCDCLDPIDEKRLQAMPDAARCITCQQIHEKEQQHRRLMHERN